MRITILILIPKFVFACYLADNLVFRFLGDLQGKAKR